VQNFWNFDAFVIIFSLKKLKLANGFESQISDNLVVIQDLAKLLIFSSKRLVNKDFQTFRFGLDPAQKLESLYL